MSVITIMGPRQSGKSTLVKNLFPNYTYISLENINHREFAQNDPSGFVKQYSYPLIIDEAQYAPLLFSSIQIMADDVGKNGMYFLTGSQNFLLLEKISQSLAGRTGTYHLLPFSISELEETKYAFKNYENYILSGFYPRIYDQKLEPSEFLADYLITYIERDARQIKNIGNLRTFRNFIRLCAGHAGQIVNLSEFGNSLGISYQTVREWFSVLEASFIVFFLQPYYKTFKKRIVKSPKLYFYDTGLVSFLLGIETKEQLFSHYLKGALFENLIIADIMKNRLHAGLQPNMYYFRDSSSNEIDLLIESGGIMKAVEIKSGFTINEYFFKGLKYFQKLTHTTSENSFLVYGGKENYSRSFAQITGWNEMKDLVR